MKVFDGFVFNDEYDILELRLEIMYDHVDKITIVESDHTFTNIYKGYNLEKNMSRYEKWADKINYVKIESKKSANQWENEWYQSSRIKDGWNDATPEDLILLSINVDEIIRPEAIKYMKNTPGNFFDLYIPMFFFKFNYMDTQSNMDNGYRTWAKAIRNPSGHEIISPLRNLNLPNAIRVDHAGWHFSWMGGRQQMLSKVRSFSHTECNTPEIVDNLNIEENIKNGEDHLKRGMNTFVKVKLDDYFPKYILENKEKYKDWLIEPNDGFNSVLDYFNYPYPVA